MIIDESDGFKKALEKLFGDDPKAEPLLRIAGALEEELPDNVIKPRFPRHRPKDFPKDNPRKKTRVRRATEIKFPDKDRKGRP